MLDFVPLAWDSLFLFISCVSAFFFDSASIILNILLYIRGKYFTVKFNFKARTHCLI